MTNLIVKVGAEIEEFKDKMREVSKELSATVKDANSAVAGFDRLGSSLTTMGTTLSAAVTLPLVGLGAASVTAAAQLQLVEVGFTNLLGSGELARDLLAEIKAIALSSPFEFPDLARAAQYMLALGLNSQEAIQWLKIIGDQAAAMGRGAESIDLITKALTDMLSKGRVSAQEMNQLAENGIRGWDILAKAFGQTVADTKNAAEQGMLDASASVQAILADMHDHTAGQMEKQNDTIKGQFSNLKEQLRLTFADIGTALLPVTDAALKAFKDILDVVSEAANAFATLPPPVQEGVLVMVALAAAIGPVVLIMGQMFSAASTLSSGLFAAQGVISSLAAGELPLLATALSTVASAATLAAGAFAGFKVGEWAYANIPGVKAFGDTMADLWLLFPGVSQAANFFAEQLIKTVEPTKDLGAKVKETVDQLKKMGVEVEDQGNRTLVQYATYLSKVKEEHGLYNNAVKDGTPHLQAHTKATKDYTEKLFDLTDQTKLQVDQEKRMIEGLNEAAKYTDIEAETIRQKTVFLEYDIQRLREQDQALQATVTSTKANTDALNDLIKVASGAKQPVDDLTAAYKTLHVNTATEARQHVEDTVAALKTLEDSHIATKGEIDQAWKQMLEAQRDYANAVGDYATGGEYQKQLDELNRQTTGASETQKSIWSGLGTQVSTIFTDMSKDIADSLFNGEFSVTKTLASVGEAIVRTFVEIGAEVIGNFITNILKGDLMDAIDGVKSAFNGLMDLFKGASSSFAPSTGTGGGGGWSGSGGGSGSGILGAASFGVDVFNAVFSVFAAFDTRDRLNNISEWLKDIDYYIRDLQNLGRSVWTTQFFDIGKTKDEVINLNERMELNLNSVINEIKSGKINNIWDTLLLSQANDAFYYTGLKDAILDQKTKIKVYLDGKELYNSWAEYAEAQ